MKTNLLKVLFAAVLCTGGGISTAYSQESGDYYLYDSSTGLFLSRGANFGTEATVDKYGIPFTWNSDNGTIVFKDWANVGLHVETTNAETNITNVYTDNATPTKFTFVSTDGGYYLQSNESSTLYARHDNGTLGEYVNMVSDQSKATVWQLKTKAEHDDIVNAYPTENKEAVAKAAGITGDFDTATKYYISQVVATIAPTEYTFTKIRNIEPAGDANNGNPREVFQGTGYFAYTATGLAKGIYKVSIPAFERDGTNENCVALSNDDYYITTSYLSAGNQQVQIKGWAENRANDNNPNSIDEANALFNNGKYNNEIYAYVGDNGNLEIRVSTPSFVPTHWFIMGNTTITKLTEGVDEATVNAMITKADELDGQVMNATTKTTLESAKADMESDKTSKEKYQALSDAVTAAENSVSAYQNAKTVLDARKTFVEKTTNFYTTNARTAYYDNILAEYNNSTLDNNTAKDLKAPEEAGDISNLLMDGWTVETINQSNLHINTWTTDGGTFGIPFYEFFTSEEAVTPDNSFSGTIDGLKPNSWYSITAIVRPQLANGQTGPIKGITMQVGNGDTVAISGTLYNEGRRYYIDTYTAYGQSDANGNLTLKFNIKDTNSGWLAFQHVKYAEYNPQEVTIGESKFATCVTTDDVNFENVEGLKAYTAKYDGKSTITLTQVTKVPANTAIVLYGNAGTYTLAPTSGATTLDNDLKASDGTVKGGNTIWCLTSMNGAAGFAPTDASFNIPEGKAYLEIGNANAKFIAFDGAVTSISNISANAAQDNAPLYNLAGQKVGKNYKGIVIKNGKKVIVK